MTEATESFEIKASAGAHAGEMADRFDDLATAFETFKRTNEQRIVEIERRGAADVVTEDKLTRLNAALDGAYAGEIEGYRAITHRRPKRCAHHAADEGADDGRARWID